MRIKLTLTAVILFCTVMLQAQDSGCGVTLTPEQEAYVDKNISYARSFNGALTRGIVDVPVLAHVISRTDGTGGIELDELRDAIEDLNEHYVHSNMRFVLLEKVNYIKNDNHYNFNVDNEDILGRLHDVKDVINLYITNTISSGTHSLCGYAYFPPGNDRVMMSKYCINNGSTLPHEIGHYFMLFHTHGKSNNGSTDELVDGSNCASAGDRICDTPSDPNLAGKVTRMCEYTGKMRDRNGEYFKPDANNMMSYSFKECRQHFSEGQYARMNYALLHHRNYLRFPPKDIVSPTSSYKSRLSGKLNLEIAGKEVDTEVNGNLFKANEGFYGGTNFQMYISNNESAYVYVLGSNLTKNNDILFPLEYQSAFLRTGQEKFALPGEDFMYQMDETKGKDYFCVLYSKKPLDLEKINAEMKRRTGTFMQRLYKSLGRDVVPSNMITYKADNGLYFEANTNNQSIVPIVVEVPHL